MWLLWQTVFSGSSDRYLWFVPSAWSSFWFLVFQASQVLFLLGTVFVTTCQEKEAASMLDVVSGVWKLTWNSLVGASWEPEAAQYLSSKISTTRDQIIFTFLCAISGFLSLVSLASTQIIPPNMLNIGVRGAALGLVYACLHRYQKKQVLSFPIIQVTTLISEMALLPVIQYLQGCEFVRNFWNGIAVCSLHIALELMP